MTHNMEKEENTDEMSNLCKQFGDTTSMLSFVRIVGKSSPIRRFVWLLLVLVGTGWAMFFIIQSVQDYYSYPVTTLVTVRYARSLEFPSVTICNTNPVRVSRINSTMKEQYYGNISSESSMGGQDTVYKIANNFIPKQRKKMGHQIKDMLINCYFDSMPCGVDNFTMTFSKKYSTCYTFRQDSQWIVQAPGPEYGLTISLNVQEEEYPIDTTVRGVVVLVQSNQYPFPEFGGSFAGAMGYTGLAVRKEEVHRLPKPYGDCYIEDLEAEFIKPFTNLGYNYSFSSCLRACYQEGVVDRCGCCDESYPCPTSGPRHVDLCTVEKHNCVMCAEEDFWRGALGDSCVSECRIACDKIQYKSTISTVVWPPYQKANGSLGQVSLADTESSYVKLSVFFDDMSYLVFTDKAAYDWTKLLSDVGGQLGLWLGFSLITAMEIVELLIDTGVLLIKSIFRKTRQIVRAQ